MARIACCLATYDGDVHRPDALSDGDIDIEHEIRRVAMVDLHGGPSTLNLALVGPDELVARENSADLLFVYEVPKNELSLATSSVSLGAVLTCQDRIELVAAAPRGGTRGHRILRVTRSQAGGQSPQHQSAERAYLDLLRELHGAATKGAIRPDRTGTGTFSVFGRQVRFDIGRGIPLLTTKKLAWKKVLEELLWFARGETDVGDLKERGVHIWDGNSTRGFLDARGLTHLAEGDIGPAYGFQWRHFGAEYRGAKCGDHAKYAGEGVDQLARIESELKRNPFSRRLYMTAWNASDVDRMALPPCHVSAQFYASPGDPEQPGDGNGDGKLRLSCHLYQRSVDTFLGFPWNIASYSMLTHIMAARCGMTPHELIVSTGDTHIYVDHVEAASTQLARAPRPMPALWLSDRVATSAWHELSAADFDVCGYYPHPCISARMSV